MIVLAILLMVSTSAYGQDCEASPQDGFIFPRVFYVTFSGPFNPPATKASLTWGLGGCGNLDEFAQEAIDYFEPFGLDLEAARRNPYQTLDTPTFSLVPGVRNPAGNSRIVYETFFNYAKYRDTPLIYISWVLYAKTDINGPGRSLPADHLVLYGMYRFQTHGREFCVLIRDDGPVVDFFTNQLIPVNWNLYSKEWGQGAARGMFSTRNNGTIIDAYYAMTFPADIVL